MRSIFAAKDWTVHARYAIIPAAASPVELRDHSQFFFIPRAVARLYVSEVIEQVNHGQQ
jgi:hypothetical protein